MSSPQDKIEAVNQAESVINDVENKMEEFKDQLPENEVCRLVRVIFILILFFMFTRGNTVTVVVVVVI